MALLMTHPTTTRLPGDLSFAYAAYKRGTAKVVKWLTTAAAPKFTPCSPQPPPSPLATRSSITCGHQPLTIDDLRALADYILYNSIPVPDDVLFSFHNTLEARDCMTCWYQQIANAADQEATEGHIIFNAVLRGIYKDLRSVGRRSSKGGTGCCEPEHCSNLDAAFSNTFSCLNINDNQDVIDQETAKGEWKTPAFGAEHVEVAQIAIKDDSLERLMCLHVYQEELAQLSAYVEEIHVSAGKGHIPLAITATITTLAYSAARKLGQELHKDNIYNPQDLFDKLSSHARNESCTHDGTIPAKSSDFLTSMQWIWQRLTQFKQDVLKQGIEHVSASDGNKCAFQNAFEWFGMHDSDSHVDKTLAEQASLESILRTMLLRIKQMRECSNHGRYSCLQLLSDLDAYLRSDVDTDTAVACHVTFGLHILLTSYKSYLHGCQLTNRPWKSADANPRLQALALTRNLKSELKAMLVRNDAPCSCLVIDGAPVISQLNALYRKYDVFLSTPRFELLIQSPWISGEHMIENMNFASRYGFKAWHHGYYVGLVLHTYNALLQSGYLTNSDIPVLEALCEIWKDEVFLGCRTPAKLYTSYKRWTGGYLKFGGHHHKKGPKTWDMCVSADPSKGGNKEARAFRLSKKSLFAMLADKKHTNVIEDEEVAEMMIAAEEPGLRVAAIKRKAQQCLSELHASGGYAAYLRRIQRVVITEFGGIIPAKSHEELSRDDPPKPGATAHSPTPPPNAPALTLTNPFTIYVRCLSTLSAITTATHDTSNEPGTICRCICERTLSAAERWMCENRRACSTEKRVLFPDKEAAETCKKFLVEGFGEVEVEEVMWRV